MSSSSLHSRQPAGMAVHIARSLILIATLIPVTVFFVRLYTISGEEKSLAERERHGVEYLSSVWQLTLSLVEAQSAVVGGTQPADAGAVAASVAAVDLIDQRLGAELRTHDRWAALRTKIKPLPAGPTRNATAAYTAYTQTTEQLLGLYAEIRQHAGLIQDPDVDAFFLQDAITEQLPRMLIAAGRLTDLTHLAGARSADDETTTITNFTVVRNAVTGPAQDLSDDLQSAVDGARSRTLSGTLLSQLETFGRRMDAFTAASAPGAGEVLPRPAQVDDARTGLQFAAADLGNAILLELDGLFGDRIGSRELRQWWAVAAYAVAVLLVATGVALPSASRYLGRRRGDVPARAATDPDERPIGPVGRPLVTTSVGPGVPATGGGRPAAGRSDAAR